MILRLVSLFIAISFAFSCEEKTPVELPPPQMPEEVVPNNPSEPGSGIEISVMSFNVRYPASSDEGEKAWTYRLKGVKAMLQAKNPDLIGVQECYPSQRDDILAAFKQYKYYGVLRSNGKDEDGKSETTTIFYNSEKFELVEKGTFWLSETPNTPSTGWDATIKRTTTWVLLKEKTSGKHFYYFNTHLDHAGVQAQVNGAKLIRTKMLDMNKSKLPVILTGDMNVAQASTACKEFDMNNARKDAEKTDNLATCHGYGSKNQQIDHIFYEGFNAKSYQTVIGPWDGITYISDHHPVMAVLEF